MKKTRKELLEIQKEQDLAKAKANEEHERRELSISLGICPECGEKIISEETEVLDKPETYLFGLIKKYHLRWGYRTVCPKDKSHYENKGDYFDDEYSF